MIKPGIHIALIFVLGIFNLPSANAITNGVQAAEGLAVKVSASSGDCSGAVWQSDIIVTAAHCVIAPSGAVATGIRISVWVKGSFYYSEVAGVIVPKEYSGDSLNIYGQSSAGDIAFLILKDKLWDIPLYPNLRLANSTDWETYRSTQTWLETIGYGLTNPGSKEMVTKAPNSAMFYINVNLSAGGGKDWGTINSNTSAICTGDSGGPVIYYREAEKALVLVGVILGSTGLSTDCGSSQFGSYTTVFTKLSSYAGLSASAFTIASKYRLSADIISLAKSNLESNKIYVSDLDDFANQLPLSTKKRLISKNKNIFILKKLVDEFETKIYSQEEFLNETMDFSLINSTVLAVNAPDVSRGVKTALNGYHSKIENLVEKIYKQLPSYVCVKGNVVRDLSANKKCPKGYEKTELPKPF